MRLAPALACLLANFCLALSSDAAALTDSVGVTGLEIANAAQPQLCASASGRVWLTYGRAAASPVSVTQSGEHGPAPSAHGHGGTAVRAGGEIFATYSDDAGLTFAPPLTVAKLPTLSLGNRRGPRIAAFGERITVTVMEHELLAFTSADSGKTWSDPVVINDVPDSAREGLHDLAVSPDGMLFVTWLDLRNGTMELWGAASPDGGRTWGADEQIYRSPEKSICECCHPSALFDADGNLAVMWRNSLGGCRDLWLALRPRGAPGFSAPFKLGEGTWKLNACPMDGGRLIAFGRGVFGAVWQRAGEIFLSRANTAEVSLGQGKQPVAVRNGDHTSVVWQQGTELVVRPVADASEINVLATDARFPSLAVVLNTGSVILAYETGPKGATSVRARRL